MSEAARERLKKLTSKYRKVRTKQQYRADAKLAAADARFAELFAEGKRPPVDMFGHPISPTALENYVSSSDEENAPLPPEALPSSSDSDELRTSDANSRIALSNLPWRCFTAADLFALLSRALAEKSEELLTVTVYVSLFGQEHPAGEDDPPPDGLDEETRNAIWRRKEKMEMKRHFAIAMFASGETADQLYQALNGCEIEDSGSYFDLASVPEDMSFAEFPVRDTASSIREDWTMPVVESPWMNKSKPTEQWDDPKSDRLRAIQAIWDAEDSTDNEVAVSLLIASSSEAEDRPTREELLDLLEGEEEEEGSETDKEDIDVKFVPTAPEPPKPSESEEPPADRKKSRKERRKEAVEQAPDEEAVKEILEDERFADMFAKPGYGINAADPKFKRSPVMDKFMAEVAKKHQTLDGFDRPTARRRPK
jgi:hypothetical protein